MSKTDYLKDPKFVFGSRQIIQEKATTFAAALFMGIDGDEISMARVVLHKMMSNLEKMEQSEQE